MSYILDALEKSSRSRSTIPAERQSPSAATPEASRSASGRKSLRMIFIAIVILLTVAIAGWYFGQHSTRKANQAGGREGVPSTPQDLSASTLNTPKPTHGPREQTSRPPATTSRLADLEPTPSTTPTPGVITAPPPIHPDPVHPDPVELPPAPDNEPSRITQPRSNPAGTDNQTRSMKPVANPQSSLPAYKVIGIHSGCDIEIDSGTGKLSGQRVQLADIRCPNDEPWATLARRFTIRQAFTRMVHIRLPSSGRGITVVLDNGQSLNRLLVQHGLAWASTAVYARDETHAKLQSQGFWLDPPGNHPQ